MKKPDKIIMLGSTETQVRQRQHDNNPGKVIVDIFCRGIDIPEEELSDALKSCTQRAYRTSSTRKHFMR